MSLLLNLDTSVVCYESTTPTNNPQRRTADWKRSLKGLQVSKPNVGLIAVAPLTTSVVFSGSRTVNNDATTQFALSLSTIASDRYRFKWTGVGTAPAFRTDRALALATFNAIISVGANQVATITSNATTPFSAVQVGDTVFIPGVATGDAAGPFNPLNTGEWTVLTASSTTLTMVRSPETVFSGITETVAVTANTQFRAYSSDNVQVGDTLDVLTGFAASTLGAYRIVSVTDNWVEFLSSLPLSLQTITASTIAVYSACKRFVYLETDQEVVAKFNGDSTDLNRVAPWVANDSNYVGYQAKVGPTWALSIKNRSTVPANVVIVTAE